MLLHLLGAHIYAFVVDHDYLGFLPRFDFAGLRLQTVHQVFHDLQFPIVGLQLPQTYRRLYAPVCRFGLARVHGQMLVFRHHKALVHVARHRPLPEFLLFHVFIVRLAGHLLLQEMIELQLIRLQNRVVRYLHVPILSALVKRPDVPRGRRRVVRSIQRCLPIVPGCT